MSRRNVTIGFSEDEFMRIQGAAALARTPISTYLKWLLRGSPVDGISKYMSVILATLEEIKIAIANLSSSRPAQPRAPIPQATITVTRAGSLSIDRIAISTPSSPPPKWTLIVAPATGRLTPNRRVRCSRRGP